MTTTTVDTPALASRIPYSEQTRVVAAAHPHLIEPMQKAAEEKYRHEATWQEECARQQSAGGLPEQHLESPYGRALREATAAVTDAFAQLVSDQNERNNRQ